MTRNHWIVALTAGAALMLWGCDDGGSSTNAPPAVPPIESHTGSVDDHAGHDHADHDHAADTHVEEAGEQINEAAGAAAWQPPAATDDAQTLLQQAIAYINENKLDLAEQTLDQLEGMDLPEGFATQVADARKLLEAKKAMDAAGGAADSVNEMLGQ